MKWDDYLLDIQNAVQAAGRENAVATYHQTSQFTKSISGISGQLDALRSDLNIGFSLLAERLDLQNELMETILGKLQDIHITLQSPLMTRAEEFLRIGREHLKRGLNEKALSAFLSSEKLYDVNCVLQLNIGLLYLYGYDEAETLIDFDKAEKHFLAAAKYAKAMEHELEGGVYFYEQGWLQAATIAYLRSSDAARLGRQSDALAYLQKAIEYCSKEPFFRDRSFLMAKCLSLTGEADAALKQLSWLIDNWRGYLPKAIEDPDFAAIRDKVLLLRKAVGPATASVQETLGAAQTMIRRAEGLDVAGSFTSHISELQSRVQQQHNALQSDVGVVSEIKDAGAEIIQGAKQLAQEILASRISAFQQRKSPLSDRLSKAESALQDAKREKMEFWPIFLVSWFAGSVALTVVGCGLNLMSSNAELRTFAFYAAIPNAIGYSFILALGFALFRLPVRTAFYSLKKTAISNQVAPEIAQLDKQIQELRTVEQEFS
jgi:tetratricopeptide (TPR) repeat protein